MPVEKNEIEEIVKKVVAEVLAEGKKLESLKPVPKCEIKWKDDAIILECESTADRDRAKEILEKGDVILKVKPKSEEDMRGK
jgi:hypothetical protein